MSNEINTDMSGLDDVASQEMARLNARVQEFQRQADAQVKMQQSITELHDTCFDVCVKDASSSGLTKVEKKCVKNCVSRYFEGYETMIKHFTAKQQQQ